MKKLINHPEDVVREALEGLAAAHPETLRVNLRPAYVVRADAPLAGKVGVLSGGGSGHEPLHTGYVGRGMLDAACPGPVFTSPTPTRCPRPPRRSTGAAAICRSVNDSARSMGIALTSCTVPQVGRPTFDLGEDEMEVGIGIHGEPGRSRSGLRGADEIVEMLAGPVLDELGAARGDQVLAFVNGMGATPLLELYVVYRRLHALLEELGLRVVRRLVGSYITSLDMAGCSVTLLKMDPELLRLWDAPVF